MAKRIDQPVHVDAQQVYLPAAHAFLEQGWAYFLTPESYRVVPLAYLWPALWGADPEWIRLANGGLWMGCVYFLWRTSDLLGGYRAGVVAMLLWAFHPELPRYFATELTEPIFLFGLFGWMHAMAQIWVNGKTSLPMAAQGAVMLAITLLSRPVLQLLAPAGLAFCLACLVYWHFKPQRAGAADYRKAVGCISLSLALGLLLPLALVLKNGMVFGLWGLGTGSGTGLYLGTHPLFQGAEPPFLGFNYDVNILAGLKANDGDHLSLVADRAARNAALWQIQAMAPAEALAFFSRKLWWWLAHHPAQIDVFGSALRKLRLFELLVLIAGATAIAYRWFRGPSRSIHQTWGSQPNRVQTARLTFAAMLLMLFVLMVVQLIPILYNSRYSSALLDPWLIPLAACSVAYLTASIRLAATLQKSRWSLEIVARQGASIVPTAVILTCVTAIAISLYNVVGKRESTSVDSGHMGQTLEHLSITSPDRVTTNGMKAHGSQMWVTTESPSVLQVHLEQDDIEKLAQIPLFNALWETEIALRTEKGQRCRKAEVSYQTADGAILQPHYRLPLLLQVVADGVIQRLTTHANGELRPRQPGSLRTVLHCPVGTMVEWRQTRFLESRHPWDAASHIRP